MQYLLATLGLFYISLFFLALSRTRNSEANFTFIYRSAFWLGAFVWEDLMIFSVYHTLAVFTALVLHDLRVGFLMFGIFWAVRSTGEMIYFFLQQFHEPQHHPHHLSAHLVQMRFFLGNISNQKGYILLQTLHQTVIMIAITCIVLLLLNWHNLPAWVNV
jgi:hypothetical protein